MYVVRVPMVRLCLWPYKQKTCGFFAWSFISNGQNIYIVLWYPHDRLKISSHHITSTSAVCVCVWQWRILFWGQNVNERDVNNRQSIFFRFVWVFHFVRVLSSFSVNSVVYFFAKVHRFLLAFFHSLILSLPRISFRQLPWKQKSWLFRCSVFEHSKMCVL